MIVIRRALYFAAFAMVAGQAHAQSVAPQYSVDSVIKSMTNAPAEASSSSPTSDCPAGRTPDGDCPAPKVTSVQGFSIAGMNSAAAKPVNTLQNTAPAPVRNKSPSRKAVAVATVSPAAPSASAAAEAKFNMLISFEKNSYTLTPQAQANALTFAQALNSEQLKSRRLLIGGHTDKKGPREMNLELSQKRADAVKNYLVSQGVSETRLDTRGFGFDRPLPSHSATDPDNRRVEAAVLN